MGLINQLSPKTGKQTYEIHEHWFGFGETCVRVTEHRPREEKLHNLFFLHGRYGHAESWNSILCELAQSYRCFSLDLPGFGRSFHVRGSGLSLFEAAILTERLISYLIDARENVILIGHDIGAAIAQLAAIRGKERVEGLILLNALFLHQDTPFSGSPVAHFALPRKLKHLLSQTAKLTAELKETLLSPWKMAGGKAGLTHALRDFSRSWPSRYERKIWQEAVKELELPFLILWGELDSLNLSEDGMAMMGTLKDAQFFAHPGCGHWLCSEDPAWVSAKIREFCFKVRLAPEKLKPIRDQKFLSR